MSHTAAAFILEKSNKMLLMFKALKRKPNANTATTTQSDTSMSSVAQLKQTSAVNCMDLSLNISSVTVLQNNNNNIILRDKIIATKLVIQDARLHFLINHTTS